LSTTPFSLGRRVGDEGLLFNCTHLLMTFEEFVEDERTYDAVLLNLHVIGEAVKNIPPFIRERFPRTEWRKIAGLRDLVAHAYFQIDPEIIWDIVKNKVPPLQVQIQQLVESEFGDRP
jgi:uncharacterized protein with HEPN domain